MREGLITMSQKELDRLHIIKKVCDKELSQRLASERLGISVRQVKRLVSYFRESGDSGLVSKQRNKRSNNQLKQTLKDEVSRLIAEQYHDFGPSLTSEKLKERHNLIISKETIRQMKISLGIHIPKSRKAKRLFQLRERRPRLGEMVQIDGSHHAWFENRGKKCCLIVFIDDATSRLLSMFFHPSESTHAYIKAIKNHILSHGCPLSYYSDRHGIFRVNIKEPKSGDGMTQLGRILKGLNIESICALTPQAKGRVERANQTLQDRFIKEMRLEGISTIEEANVYIPKFIDSWNQRFSIPPVNLENAHKTWEKSEAELDLALAYKDSRVISKSLTFQYEGGKYCIKTKGPGTSMQGGRIDISRLHTGEMQIHYKGKKMEYTRYGNAPMPSPVEDEKTIDARIDEIILRNQKEEKILKAGIACPVIPFGLHPHSMTGQAIPAQNSS